jgi:phosphatidylserine/phosphatidylglycerophosphate/cardiolipin synthase-like enzyme
MHKVTLIEPALVLLLATLLVSGCTIQPPKLTPPVRGPQPVRPVELSCPKDDALRCSIPSPLHDLAERVFTAPPTETRHYATILDIGDDALAVRVHLIRAARESIELQTFIWDNDEVGHLVLGELLKAAQRGVEVRIIADQLYSGQDPGNAARLAVTHANLQIKVFNPIGGKTVTSMADMVGAGLFDFNTINHRMHNKVLVIDDRIGITGGRNIENKYYDRDPEFDFIDRDVLVVGPVAGDMRRAFDEYWADPVSVDLHQTVDVNARLFKDGVQQDLPPFEFPSMLEFDDLIANADDADWIRDRIIDRAYRVSNVEFASDRPQKVYAKDDEADLLVNAGLRDVLRSAEHSILAQTPYFVLSNDAFKGLKRIRKRHPDIEFTVVTNSLASTDSYLVYALSFKRKKRNLKKLKFRIHEIKAHPADAAELVPRYETLAAQREPGTASAGDGRGPTLSIHAKAIVVDGRVAIIGSHNFDPRSTALNTEVTLTIRDEAFATALEQSIRRITAPRNSWVIARQEKVPLLGHISGLLGTISNALPVFDELRAAPGHDAAASGPSRFLCPLRGRRSVPGYRSR